MSAAHDILTLGPIIPVITLERAEDALPLADALAEGGIKTMEVTLRTGAALDAIKLLAQERKNMVVGAGTITSADGFARVKDVGAQFIISPGITDALLTAGKQCGVPYIPGISTTSEALLAMQHGFDRLKFFPAALAGGVGMLKNFAALFGNVKFCPTGGITQANMNEYLGQPNVLCVGGSWIVPTQPIREGKWGEITMLVKEALAAVKR
ncbi:MAG TPA: bifunctional 4-hydroxy-2-oxoglutarate aldolase/2-dehydro-3-deoxy-phosphogluconate aldolase [Rickettsiales bacterium]|nr:bifunctional 4-hydroxy-2-oxoglutarate aldolase/2-dehydro-3-deoxy-phosphogluconate aldolase [Rickettsiales bacterium]